MTSEMVDSPSEPEQVTAGNCEPGQHNWSYISQPGIVGWIKRCSSCGWLDLDEHDFELIGQLAKEIRESGGQLAFGFALWLHLRRYQIPSYQDQENSTPTP
jgi:hypothetical protein